MHVWLLMILVGVSGVAARSGGAPQEACNSMTPNHGPNQPSSGGSSLYSLSVTSIGNSEYEVTLSGAQFRGFFIQARSDSTGNDALGEFFVPPAADFKARPCPNANALDNGITHKQANPKTSITALWRPEPGQSVEGVFIQASVVAAYGTFYTGLQAPLP